MRLNRRQWIATAAGVALPIPARTAPAPTSRVAVARCHDYGPELYPAIRGLLDGLGGIGPLVRGKTVGVKVNLTGGPTSRVGAGLVGRGAYTHPHVIGVFTRLLGEAGATRIRILEGCFSSSDPLEEFMYEAGWDAHALLNAARNVEMENTNVIGRGGRYHRRMTPSKGLVFPGFDFNHAYDECDVIVSLAKLKEHATCGITLAMKNMFGATPTSIYGDFAGKDEPSEEARGGRGLVMHAGSRPPSASAPQEIDPAGPRADGWRIPRIVTDICAALPIHISLIDGIETLAGGEGPWVRSTRHVKPGILVAGLNPVSTDSVAASLMGFDPLAGHGQRPFEYCDSTLLIGEQQGLGTRDLNRIEIAGPKLADLRFDFRSATPGPWIRRQE